MKLDIYMASFNEMFGYIESELRQMSDSELDKVIEKTQVKSGMAFTKRVLYQAVNEWAKLERAARKSRRK